MKTLIWRHPLPGGNCGGDSEMADAALPERLAMPSFGRSSAAVQVSAHHAAAHGAASAGVWVSCDPRAPAGKPLTTTEPGISELSVGWSDSICAISNDNAVCRRIIPIKEFDRLTSSVEVASLSALDGRRLNAATCFLFRRLRSRHVLRAARLVSPAVERPAASRTAV